ncbi:cytochrome P450 [Streptomyces sp. NPDC005917]|uniref:cytochrome P450 n=1 Tax=unclassified Streptomyces TaxID=2593676 RepID=UPI0033D7DBD7
MDVRHTAATGAARCPMYDGAFADNPQKVYDQIRAHAPAGPVELAPGVDATLVVGHEMALRVLQSSGLFVRDARRWAALNDGRVPLDSPVLAMMAFRPNCLFTDGAVHQRLRTAVTESLDRLNTTRIRRDVEPITAYLIDRFSEQGQADLINDYAKLLPLLLFNKLFGCPADIGDTVTSALSDIFDGKDALRASEDLTAALMELIALKRREPADDVTSWLIQHPAGLTDQELSDQLVMLMGAGAEPERNLIANALLVLLGHEGGSSMQVEDALDHVLLRMTPIANYATHYPLQDIDLGGYVAEANSPVVISFAGANGDPVLTQASHAQARGAHLAWGAGAHACPVKGTARVIASTAIEQLLNALPDVSLAVPAHELRWRPGPFHRALFDFPAKFSPVPASRRASSSPSHRPARSAQPAPAAAGSAPLPQQQTRKGLWRSFLDIFSA